MSKSSTIRTRIAPSPTGQLHIGTLRAALFNWLFTKNKGGQFIVRIEDTDKERSEKKYEDEIMDGLKWLGLNWDEGPDIGGPCGPYRQSERKEIYKKEIKKLIENGFLYFCFCTKEELETIRQAHLAQGIAPVYSKKCRHLDQKEIRKNIRQGTPYVLRFKTPENSKVAFNDVVRGRVEFETSTLGDMVVAKDIENPLFALAGVIDDHHMGITHVIRGEDHLPNTPKQILFQEALGFSKPVYAHLPLILSSDRKKLSKRYAETSILEYRRQGYLPEAMLNFIAFLGWHPTEAQSSKLKAQSSGKEIFTKEELIKEFDFKRVQKAGAVFNIEKLDWINFEYIRALSEKDLEARLKDFVPEAWLKNKKFFSEVVSVHRSRIKKLSDFKVVAKLFFELPEYDPRILVWRKNTGDNKIQITLESLEKAYNFIAGLSESDFKAKNFSEIPDNLSKKIIDVLDEDRGLVLWPLRVALSGSVASPDPYEILAVLGKKESLRRISGAINDLKSLSR